MRKMFKKEADNFQDKNFINTSHVTFTRNFYVYIYSSPKELIDIHEMNSA